ncbi:MAG: VanZ family protein [Bacteroidetes bacterium]|nr:VanZ family protein [Bacteroidota bacterium]
MQFLKYKAPAIIWFLVILALCSMPGKSIPHISWLELLSFDKFVHASIFFGLQILTMRAFVFSSSFPKLKWLILLFCVTYGGALEIMQSAFFSERSGDVFDFIANSFGCVCGLLLFSSIRKKFPVFF